MAWTAIASAAGGLLGGITDTIVGEINQSQARDREKALGPAPEFTIPESVDKYINYQKRLSQRAAPGYGEELEAIEEGYATDVSSASQLGDNIANTLDAMGGLSGRRSMDLRKLGQAATQQQIAADMGYSSAVLSKAPYELMPGEYDFLKWQIGKNEVASLRGSSQAQLSSSFDQLGAMGSMAASMYNPSQQYQQQSPYQPYDYGNAGASMNQMGQQQASPAINLGSDPYPDTGVPQTGWTEDWMTQPF